MRLIDADKLILSLNDNYLANSPTGNETLEIKEYREAMCEGLEIAMATVEGAPTANGWIGVKDRKPPSIREPRYRNVFSPVLLYTKKDKSVYIGWYLGEDYKGIDCYISRTAMTSYQHITKKITHWMPLPVLPEEESDD